MGCMFLNILKVTNILCVCIDGYLSDFSFFCYSFLKLEIGIDIFIV